MDPARGVRVHGGAVDEEFGCEVERRVGEEGVDDLVEGGVVADADEGDGGGADSIDDGLRDGGFAGSEGFGVSGCPGGGTVVQDYRRGLGAFFGEVTAHALWDG